MTHTITTGEVGHTGGPWELSATGWVAHAATIYSAERKGGAQIIVGQVGSAFNGPDDAERAAADARLIAAAPDLLKELRHLVRLLEPLERDGSLNVPGLATLNGARAAIARTEARHD